MRVWRWRCGHAELRAGEDRSGREGRGAERGEARVVVITSQGERVSLRLLLGAALQVENKLTTVAKRQGRRMRTLLKNGALSLVWDVI